MAEALDKQKHTLILGAGPSGLGTAMGIALNGRPSRVTIIEKKDKTGGLSGSFRWKNHTIDYGPHRLSPNIKNIQLLADELLGSNCLIKKSQHGVQFKGKLYQFPPRAWDWLSPFSMWQLVRFGISFFAGKFHWITNRFATDNFETTVIRKFGKLFFKDIAEPMASKVWTEPNRIDPNFVNQRFALVHPMAVISKIIFPKQELNPSNFFYPKQGFQQLWDHMADYVAREGTEVSCSSTPKAIHVENNRIVSIELDTPSGSKTISGSDLFVVSTIPVLSLVRCLKGVDTQAYEKMLEGVRVKSMLLVSLEFEQEKTLPYRTLIFPEREYIFNRLFEQNAYSRDTVEEGKSVIVADITPYRGDEMMSWSDERVIEKVRSDLSKLKYIPIDKISDINVNRVEFAYVVPDHETRQNFKELCFQLRRISNLELIGRFATGEYDNSDYAIENGLTLGALLSGRITKLDYMSQLHFSRDRNIVG